MDRGRAGGFVTDNNFSGIQIRKKQQKEHLHRLEKIKARKPGSSVTLDNNAPVIIKAMTNNPRKRAIREQNWFALEMENK
jgi:ribosomal protein L14